MREGEGKIRMNEIIMKEVRMKERETRVKNG